MTKSGEQDITLLVVKRAPLLWSKSLYGYLVAVDYACLGMGTMLLLPALVRYFNMGDIALILTGTTFKTLRLFMLAFADVTWLVFMAVFLGAPSGMIISACKSIISKTVAENELGKVFSLLSCSEMLSNLLGSLIFTSLYSSFIEYYPGFVFTLDGAVYVVVLLLLIGFGYLLHQDQRLNLLYNTLEYPDYGSNDAGGKGPQKGVGVGAGEEEAGEVPGLEEKILAEKRLSRISEEGVERMSVANSKWNRKDSSSSSEEAHITNNSNPFNYSTTNNKNPFNYSTPADNENPGNDTNPFNYSSHPANNVNNSNNVIPRNVNVNTMNKCNHVNEVNNVNQ